MNPLIKSFLLFFALLTGALQADEKNFVTLDQEQVHEGDYFVSGGSIEIYGRVKGDLFAIGSRVVVRGIIEGDVMAAGGTVEMAGTVRGNARLVGGQIELLGTIEKNATIAGGNVESDPLSVIGGNLVVTGGIVDLSGTINGNLTLAASNARLLGKVLKNLKAHVGQLRLGPSSLVGGNLDYSSSTQAQIDQGARISGQVSYHPSAVSTVLEGKWRKGFAFGFHVMGLFMNLIFTFVIGWALIRFFPDKVRSALLALQKRPGKSFWTGLLVLFLLPLFTIILFITILGFPLALALLALTLLTFYTAKIFPILWLSQWLFNRIHLKINRLLSFFFGIILFLGLTQIPGVGGLISFAFTLFGLGAVMLGRAQRTKNITN